MSEVLEIYVSLPDEAVDVWRPVKATRLHDQTYRILPQPYDRTIERWQFEPGDEVECGMIALSDGEILAAIRKAV